MQYHYVHYFTLHYATLHYSTLHYTTLHYTTLNYNYNYNYNCNYTDCTTLQLQLPLHYNYNYNCTTPHYIQQLWVRWPLQPLQSLQKTHLQPPFGPSVESLCHPWFTTTHLSYRFLIFETSATALCGTTGSWENYRWGILRCHGWLPEGNRCWPKPMSVFLGSSYYPLVN